MAHKGEIKDAILIARYQSGDHKAFALLVKKWHKKFCHQAYWLVQDSERAKDIAQESWHTIFKSLLKLKNPESFASWAKRIVYNKAIDSIRKKSKELQKQHAYIKALNPTIEEDEDTGHLKTKLLKEIKKLSDKQQIVLRLFYVEGYSLKEISILLGTSVGTIKSRLFYSRELLKNKLK